MSRIGPNGREEWIIREAQNRSPAEREAFLDGACAGDLGLRQRLEALLAAHDQPNPHPTSEQVASLPTRRFEFTDELPDEAVGQTLGRYKLLEKVGEGGCGVVYVADQTKPVRRRVALKVIRLGMDTKQVVARFEAERQALAMMDHPNIAKVLDGGATDTGRPYFVMELVRGIRITDYCDQASLCTRDRLELFIKVCQAIQHAHQKGIIHRDIKPSNILVTLHDGVPVPKVIDFGIAKAMEGPGGGGVGAARAVNEQQANRLVRWCFARRYGNARRPLAAGASRVGGGIGHARRNDCYLARTGTRRMQGEPPLVWRRVSSWARTLRLSLPGSRRSARSWR
jgi:serine/threonine protein kinase